MKSRNFFFLLCCTAIPFFFSSCGNNDENKTTTTDADTTATATSAATNSSNSTIVTTPQTILAVTNKISNYAKWKVAYDAHDSVRKAYGIHNYVIGRGVEDSNMILVATKADDVDKAKAFLKDPSLKASMQKSGATHSTITLTTEVYQDTATLGPDVIRSRTTYTVKDWDTWKNAFESHRQTRLDNGVVDRVYGYDVDDNHKVSLVVAITDSAKANAFWNSDLIKQQRAEAGVTSKPERFIYRIVQRY
jgi:hypothetical protein